MITRIALGVIILGIQGLSAAVGTLDESQFSSPQKEYRIGIWWHWLSGNISKDGITKDLASFAEAGIARATLFDVNMVSSKGDVYTLSPSWLDMIDFAAGEAQRFGIRLGLHIGPGWSQTGGPWITPELSMKRLVWASTYGQGGTKLECLLPELPSEAGFSKDVAVLAWPASKPESRMRNGTVKSQDFLKNGNLLWDGNPTTGVTIETRGETQEEFKKWSFKITFPHPHESEILRIFTRWRFGSPSNTAKLRVRILVHDRLVKQEDLPASLLASGIIMRYPSSSDSTYEIELSLIGAVEPWNTFRLMEVTELELLNNGEAPQFDAELKNLSSQLCDSGFKEPPAPEWREELSTDSRIKLSDIIDISSYVRNGKLIWDAPPGSWRIVRFGYTTTGKTNSPANPEVKGLESDKMSIAATDKHFDAYVRKILDAVRPDHRSAIDLGLIDSWEAGSQNWTDDLPLEFNKRIGYDMIPYLPVVAGEVVESRDITERFLNDFRETIGLLVTERFYGRFRELLNEEGLKFAAEYSHTPVGDRFEMARVIDQPMDEFMSDHWSGDGSVPPPVETDLTTVLVADAALLAGKRIVPAEAFTSMSGDFRHTPGDFGFKAYEAFIRGHTEMVLHSAAHQPNSEEPGLTLGRHGPHFNRNNTWWPYLDDWIQKLNRIQYVFQNSDLEADVLFFNGDTMPRSNKLPNLRLPDGYRVMQIDRYALINRISVEDGKLKLDGKGKFICLVLPSNIISLESLQAIEKLAKQGAVIIGPKPSHSPGLYNREATDAQIALLANSIWQDLKSTAPEKSVDYGRGRIFWTENLEDVINKIGASPNLVSTPHGNGKPLRSITRTEENANCYYLFNPNPDVDSFTISIRDDERRRLELWDINTGKLTRLNIYRREGDCLTFPVTVRPYESAIIILRGKKEELIVASSIQSSTPNHDVFSDANDVALTNENGKVVVSGLAEKKIIIRDRENKEHSFEIPQPVKIQLNGQWLIRFPDSDWREWKLPLSWSDSNDDAIRGFSGSASYKTTFDLAEADINNAPQQILDLGRVGSVARIWINGRNAGVLWRSPWRADVKGMLKVGTNVLEIEVANTWVNALLWEEKVPSEMRKFSTSWDKGVWKRTKAIPLPSGLLDTPFLLIGHGMTFSEANIE